MSVQSIAVPRPRRIFLSILLLLCGFIVMVFGSNYYSVFPTNDSQAFRAIIAAIFLAAALIWRRNESMAQYSQITYAFFIATTAFFVTSLTAGLRDSLVRTLQVPIDSPRFMALTKLFEASVVIALILLLSLLWGEDLGSLYIQKGRLGLGLFIGLSLLAINAATGIVIGATLGQAGEQLAARLPWALLFALANGFMEELWFRGLFLRRFASVIGMIGAIIVTSIPFTFMHAAASYMNPVEAVLFQLIIFPMSLLFAYLMFKLDNLWGSALYHAGSDVFLFYLMAW